MKAHTGCQGTTCLSKTAVEDSSRASFCGCPAACNRFYDVYAQVNHHFVGWKRTYNLHTKNIKCELCPFFYNIGNTRSQFLYKWNILWVTVSVVWDTPHDLWGAPHMHLSRTLRIRTYWKNVWKICSELFKLFCNTK